jgi:hypothetical protein
MELLQGSRVLFEELLETAPWEQRYRMMFGRRFIEPTMGGGDVLGGPDPAGREDIISAPGGEPNLGKDILGGPDPTGTEDELTAPGPPPASPASRDSFGGPDPAGTEDILRPPGRAWHLR